MLCEHCKQNQATIHTRQSINGVSEEHHLCSVCAEKLKNVQLQMSGLFGNDPFFSNPGFFQSAGISMNQLLQDFFQAPHVIPGASAKSTAPSIGPCPSCGMAWTDFQNNGLLGCATCYEHFSDYMPELLRRLHGATRHVGKTPVQEEIPSAEKSRIDTLRDALQTAVAEEDFEKACRLRDEIRDLEKEKTDHHLSESDDDSSTAEKGE